MHGMTAPACPVCATPYEAGATICAFCGVSLVGPEPKPAAKPKSRAKPAPKPRVEPDIPAIESPSPTPVEVVEPIADEVPSPAPVEVAESKIDELPAPAEIVEPIADETSSPTPAGVDVVDATPPAPDPDSESAEAAETSVIPEDPALPGPPGPGTQAPSFAKERAAATAAQRRLQRIEWGVVAGLAVLLLVQVVASDFGPLAANGTTRPWLQGICNALRCSLPPWHEPRALHLLQRDVQANPQRPGLLHISASFRNEARWTQPWPRLRVTLSDADGRAIAARDFAANEYLGAEPTTNGIASGQLASVAFDVADPSPRVTAFTFEFR
jgi:uncharacterized Zn finger protein (UPF0148 family)